MAATQPLTSAPDAWIELDLSMLRDISAEAFFDLCQANPTLRFERLASGEIVGMPPAGLLTSHRNSILTAAVQVWSDRDGTGIVTDSSGGFVLPNGAVRSPDVAWIRRERLAALAEHDERGFAPLCPDFVIELRSPSDRLPALRAKMQEYMANGARLAWLIDPESRDVTIYRIGARPERLRAPERLAGAPELPELVVELGRFWESPI